MLQGSIPVARSLRATMSLPEILLWQGLRRQPNGLKFRRQHPAGPFVADFYCHQARLVVEVDGEAHDRGDRPAQDAARDAWFAMRGIRVLRIPARQILSDADAVVAGVAATATEEE